MRLAMVVGMGATGETIPGNLARPTKFLHAEFGRVKRPAYPALDILEMIPQGEDGLSASGLGNSGPASPASRLSGL